ncbi:hypothetical protein WR164_12750 [Philodulcilactobacillus myokoensis]|uniref:Surface layer protein A domain-containing protein n=1 Tax=Philodulcilactobacillus myokoensis TaxID=2929573 RepID=A0A9W6B2F2_9LACO|nr:hypothetical protein [Philodulcilactobacillus myokoensis]GLB47296.1 hypothetical protein WR164_12750 [Philodulcilactobacillus myokoensis]
MKKILSSVLVSLVLLLAFSFSNASAASQIIKFDRTNLYTKLTSHGLKNKRTVKNIKFKITKHATVKNGKKVVNIEYVTSKKYRGWIYTPQPKINRQIAHFAPASNVNHYRIAKPAYLYLPNISELSDLSLYPDLQSATIQQGSSKRIAKALNRSYMITTLKNKKGDLSFQLMRGRHLYFMINPVNRINGVNIWVPYNAYLDPYLKKDANGNYKIMSVYSPNSKHALLNPQIKKQVTGKYGEFKDGTIWYDITQPSYQNGQLVSDYAHRVYQYNLSQHRWIKMKF